MRMILEQDCGIHTSETKSHCSLSMFLKELSFIRSKKRWKVKHNYEWMKRVAIKEALSTINKRLEAVAKFTTERNK